VNAPRAILLVKCPDRPGIVAAISSFLRARREHHRLRPAHLEDESAVYFTRLEFQTDRIDLPLDHLEKAFALDVARPFSMDWRLTLSSRRKRVAVLVSRQDHALLELSGRGSAATCAPSDCGDLEPRGPRPAVAPFAVPFVHVPNHATKRAEAEERMLGLLEGKADLVVARAVHADPLGGLRGALPERDDQHPPFLPAGLRRGRPLRQAYDRGVKIVGATAHYVTAQLDAGPIIEQDVGRVTHRDMVEDLKHLGRDLERRVLAHAVRWHCDDRVIVHGNKTVVFS